MDDNSSQNTKPSTQPETALPQEADKAQPRKQMSLFKKIIYSIIGIVCLFGLIQVALQNIFPENKIQSKPVSISPEKAQWKTYTNKLNNYSVSYPDYLDLSETKYSSVFVVRENKSDTEQFPSLYISVIPNGFENSTEIYNYMSEDSVNKFFTMLDNESLEIQSWPYAEYSNFKKLASITVLDTTGIVIENQNVLKGEGTINRRILIKKADKIYILGCFYKTQQELDAFRIFLLSFKFIL